MHADEHETILAVLDFFNSCLSSLAEWSSVYPHLRYLFEPTREWLSTENAMRIRIELSHEEESNGATEAFLNTLLYRVQVMVTEVDKVNADGHEDRETSQSILRAYRETSNFTQLLSLTRVLEQLDTLLDTVSTEKELKDALQCILPFLSVYQNLVHNQLAAHAQWTKAVLKLDYILCSTLLRLSKEGFCQPPEREEGGDDEGEALEAADGTGLGEGSGVENVSKEIEDESQVEGLKGDDEGNQEKGKDDSDDNAVEMSENFDGTLEDVPDDGSEKGEEDGKSDEESEADPEERIEELDPTDPSALDEKIWGDESGPPDSGDTQDKTGKDHSEEHSGSSEVVAKESNEKSKDETKENEESRMKEHDEEVPEAEERGEEEEGEPSAAGAPMEDHVQDTNTLDLPEDMELDVGEEEREKNIDDSEIEGEGEEELLDEKIMEDKGLDDDMAFDNNQPEGVEGDGPEEDAMDDLGMEMDNKAEAKPEDKQPESDQSEEERAPEVTARPDTSAGEGDVKPCDETQAQDQNPSSAGQAGSSAADSGQKTASQDKAIEQTGYVFVVRIHSIC